MFKHYCAYLNDRVLQRAPRCSFLLVVLGVAALYVLLIAFLDTVKLWWIMVVLHAQRNINLARMQQLLPKLHRFLTAPAPRLQPVNEASEMKPSPAQTDAEAASEFALRIWVMNRFLCARHLELRHREEHGAQARYPPPPRDPPPVAQPQPQPTHASNAEEEEEAKKKSETPRVSSELPVPPPPPMRFGLAASAWTQQT
jgi:hypothetical protein